MGIPLLVLVARIIGSGYVASGDIAAIELRVRDVFGPGVWLGPYSRFGWSHPGPLLFWSTAPVYEIAGERSVALVLVAAAVNVGAILGVVGVLRRRAPERLALACVPLAIFVLALGPHHWVSPWNPDIALMPFAFLVAGVWDRTLEDARVPVWVLALVVSFVVQAHVGYTLPATGVVLAGAGVHIIARRPIVHRLGGARDLALTAGVLAVAWFGPAAEQLNRGSGGNLAELWRYLTGDRETLGWLPAIKLVSHELSLRGSWWSGFGDLSLQGDVSQIGSFAIPVLGVAIVIIGALRTDDLTRAALVLVATLVTTATVAAASIDGVVFPYLVRWIGVLGWWATTTVVIALPARRDIARVATVAVTVALAVAVLLASTAPTEYAPIDAQIPALLADVRQAIPADAPIRVRGRGGLDAQVASSAVLLDLERAGYDVGGMRSEDFIIGGHRVLDDDVQAIDLVVGTSTFGEPLDPPQRGVEIARVDELAPAARTQCNETGHELAEAITRGDVDAIAAMGPIPCGRVIVVWRVERDR